MQKNYFRWSRLSCLHMVQTVKRNRVDVVFAFFYNGTLIVRTVLNETVIQKRQKKAMLSVDISWSMLPWMRWEKQTGTTGDQPIYI